MHILHNFFLSELQSGNIYNAFSLYKIRHVPIHYQYKLHKLGHYVWMEESANTKGRFILTLYCDF
jgi:hypothetical protein